MRTVQSDLKWHFTQTSESPFSRVARQLYLSRFAKQQSCIKTHFILHVQIDIDVPGRDVERRPCNHKVLGPYLSTVFINILCLILQISVDLKVIQLLNGWTIWLNQSGIVLLLNTSKLRKIWRTRLRTFLRMTGVYEAWTRWPVCSIDPCIGPRIRHENWCGFYEALLREIWGSLKKF